ncbi:hypothetical protein CVS40_9994 [Lucilia cuprina]|nr:hypothetical protein CVS40_9994 [Lucilia cuprina]
MSKFQERDSGWKLTGIVRAEININKWSLVKGSKCISTPPKLAKRHTCNNIENMVDYCFKWCIIATWTLGILIIFNVLIHITLLMISVEK